MREMILTRAAGRTAALSLNRAARTVEACALSGLAPAVRPGPPPDGSDCGQWVEELAANGADLSALRGAPVLLDHVATTRSAVGVVARAYLDADQIAVVINFDPSPEADAVIAKI